MFYRKTLFSFFFFCFAALVQLAGQETTGYSASNKENRTSRVNKQSAVQNYEKDFREAVKSIPWNSLTPRTREKVKSVVLNPSLYRRMPRQTVVADPEMYHFLTEHPDLVVGFWDVIGATQMALKEIRQNQYLMKEEAGTVAVVEVLYRTTEICIIYARGQYRGPFFARPCEGEAVLVFQTRFARNGDNRPYAVSDLDSFVRIDNAGVDLIAKLFATSLGKIADSNFEQTVGFVAYLSRIAANDANGVKRTVSKIQTVRPELKEDFYDVIDRVALRAANRNRPLVPIQRYEHKIAGITEVSPLQTFEEDTELIESENLSERKSAGKEGNRITDTDISVFLDRFAAEAEFGIPEASAEENFSVPSPKFTEFFLPVPAGGVALKENETAETEEKAELPAKKNRVVFGTPRIAR